MRSCSIQRCIWVLCILGFDKMAESQDNPFAPWMEQFKIEQETVEFFRFVANLGFKAPHLISLEESRENAKKLVGPVEFNGTINTMTVDVPHLQQGIQITIYKRAQPLETPPIIAYCHGGGFVLNDQSVFDGTMKKMADATGAIIVYIEYRLLPCDEDPLSPFNDCKAVIEWLMKNRKTVGGKSTSRFGIAGDSAGGHACLSAALDIKNGIDFQVLVYPIVDLSFDPPPSDLLTIPAFNPLQFAFQYRQAGILTEDMLSNPRVNFQLVDDWASVPPTLVITTNIEPLKDFNFQLVDKLKAANVSTELIVMDGVPHGFFSRSYFFPENAEKACLYIATFMNEHI